MKTMLAAAALVLLFAGQTFANPLPRYEVVPLHSLPGKETEDTVYCQPKALNNKGECAGSAGFQAVRWDADGNIHLLSTPSRRLDGAESINDQGQVIAYATASQQTLAARFYVINKTGTARLLTPPAGTQATGFIGGEAINNAGQAAFNTQVKGSLLERAFLKKGNVQTDLGCLPMPQPESELCQANVHALNNSGMAAGWSQVSLTDADGMLRLLTHAFLWRKGVMTDLGTLPGYESFSATALNNQGEVIGTMSSRAEAELGPDPSSNSHGFLWRNGAMTDLGALPGCRYTEPTGINDKDQIVGNSYNVTQEGNAFSRTGGALNGGVFLWQEGKMTDLQTLVPTGWKLQSAVGINNRGDILCTGYHDGMPSRTLGSGAFLLRRVAPAPP